MARLGVTVSLALVGGVVFAAGATAIIAWSTSRALLYQEIDDALSERVELLRETPLKMVLVHNPGRTQHRRTGRQLVYSAPVSGGEPIAVSEDWPNDYVPPDIGDTFVFKNVPPDRCLRMAQVTITPEMVREEWEKRPRKQVPFERPEGRPMARPHREDDQRRWRPRKPPPQMNLQEPVRVTIALDVTDIQNDLGRLWRLLASIVAGVALVGGALAFVVTRMILRPVRDIESRISSLNPTDILDRVDDGALPQELKPVIGTLNDRLAQLALARERERRTAADIAHELRTPLAAARSAVDVAVLEKRIDGETAAGLNEALGLLAGRVDGLMVLHRLEAGTRELKRERCSMSELVMDAWALRASAAKERGMDIRLKGEVELVGDPVLLAMLFTNLLGNAVAHGLPGSVVVEGRSGETGPQVRVQNRANGLDPDDVAHMFEPFWRQDAGRTSVERHAGLGLALCKRIAEAHGGNLQPQLQGRDFAIVLRLPH